MKHFIKSLLVFVTLIKISYAQIMVQEESLVFPPVITGRTDSIGINVYNTGSGPEQLFIKVLYDTASFKPSLNQFIVQASDSIRIYVRYSPVENVINKGILFFHNADTSFFKIIEAEGSGSFADSYYNSTFNLYDTQLKQALTNLVSGHTQLGYSPARDKMFMEIDNQRVNGQGALQNTLECVYTGRTAVGYTSRSDAQTNFSFNTEHTWPQSAFNSNEPMLSDLFHLYPTDENANSIRGNLPFGKVVSGINWQNNGSKRGLDSSGTTVFEPRDVHKGNAARTMLYFLTRYPQNYGSFLNAAQEKTYREWNKTDTPDSIEIRRNIKIASLQGKRNPYIDHPGFADRIYSFLGVVRPDFYNAELLPETLYYDSTSVGDSLLMHFYFINTGNKDAFISQVVIPGPAFKLAGYDTQILPGEAGSIGVYFIPDSAAGFTSNIIVSFNNQVLIGRLKGTGKASAVGVPEINSKTPASFSVYQNYPNPFNPATKIKFYTPENSHVKILIFNVTGELMYKIYDEYTAAGYHVVDFNASGLTSGVYFYTVINENNKVTKPMIFLK